MTTTQNCAECGTRAEPGQSFCDGCGAVLRWKDAGAPGGGASGGGAPGGGADAGPGAGVSRSRGVRIERPRARTAGGAGTTGGGTGAGGGTGTEGGGTSAGVPGAGAQPRTPTGMVEQVPWPSGREAAGREIGAEELAPSGGATGTGMWAHEHEHDPEHDPEHGTGAGTGPGAETHEAAAGTGPAIRAVGPEAPTPPHAPVPDSEAPTPYTPFAATPAPSGPGPETHARARDLLVPVTDEGHETPATPSVAPVLPGRPVADRPAVRAPGPETGAVGGPPCPWCGTPNRPDRHHCARCAMPLARRDEETEARLPWWRRLVDGRRNAVPWAGERPRLRRTFDRVLRWIVAVVVIGLVVFLGMKAPAGVQATRDHFAKRTLVTPDDFAASRSFPAHKPGLAFDGLSNTWWGPGVSESGKGEWIEARFDEPTRLLDLIITPGVSTKSNRIRESALPHRVTATITTKDGRTKTRELVLDQGPGGQRRAFGVGEVTKVRFTIDSAYGVSAKKQVAIAEIEFFGPSGDN
ncbi:NADase-type glycan-binding domain-containing protein [Streptomyces sp. P6-2-1]|uniref:NADase-type glycan-binding domain-containing protein n=1 Tax=Streptomyces sp. P6-2-1 TaxID=3422591 RepID=UPI003D369814